jgi:hypothetical protein
MRARKITSRRPPLDFEHIRNRSQTFAIFIEVLDMKHGSFAETPDTRPFSSPGRFTHRLGMMSECPTFSHELERISRH